MAGEPSLFLVYKDFTTAERNSDSWYTNQALADAAATDGGAGFTAHQGAVEVPHTWVAGWIYNPADGTWRELGYDDLSELEQRKAAATVLFSALDDQEDDLGRRRGIPMKPRGRVQDVLAFARWACYSIFTSGSYTTAQQIAWAAAMLDGPSDAADMDTLIKKAAAMTDAEVPTTTSAWVSPADGARSATAGSKAASARWNAGIGDLTAFSPGNGAWIENIT